MTLQDIIKAAQQLSLQEQMRLVSQLVQTLEQELHTSISTASLQISSKQETSSTAPQIPSLKGTVKHYDAPYEPVAIEDWDALA